MTTKQTRYIKQPEYVGRILVFPVMTTDVEIRTFERINIFCLNSSMWFELTAHSEGCLLHPDPISYGLVEVEVQGSLHFKYWYFDCRKKGFLSSNSNPTCAHMFWPVLLFSALTYSPSASSSRSTSRPLYWCETMCLHNGKNPGSNYLAVSRCELLHDFGDYKSFYVKSNWTNITRYLPWQVNQSISNEVCMFTFCLSSSCKVAKLQMCIFDCSELAYNVLGDGLKSTTLPRVCGIEPILSSAMLQMQNLFKCTIRNVN